MTTHAEPVLNQIALSCIDLVHTEEWFRHGLGLLPAGGTRLTSGTPFADDVLAAPRAEAVCWWMAAENPQLRLALLQFSEPLPRLKSARFRPCDIGYTRISVHVVAFNKALADLAELGSHPVGPVVGKQGERRACVRSPDGVFVEIMERDPLSGMSRADRGSRATIRAITVSTPDLAASIAYFSALSGRSPTGISLHDDEHEVLWGLEGAKCTRAVLQSGDVLIELAQYADPAGKPRPVDYRVSDQDILNVSFGAGSAEAFEAVRERCLALAMQASHAQLRTRHERALYLKDPLGFSVQLTWSVSAAERGLAPEPASDRPTPAEHEVVSRVTIGAPFDRVWAALNDHRRMHRWIEADSLEVTKQGTPDSAGYGAERILITMGRKVLQQVVHVSPKRIGYRAIAGTPFSYHNGAVEVSETGTGTQVVWTIRFRTLDPALGPFVRGQLQKGIPHQLEALKSMVEEETRLNG